MGRETPSARVKRAIADAHEARTQGHPEDAIPRLAAAAALVGTGPVRRELQVAMHRERAACHIALDEPDEARACLLLGLEAAGSEAALADPVRASLASLDLMSGEPRRAQAMLAQRGRDRRATLIAQARVHLQQGATSLAEAALQACEQAPGGQTDLHPPSAALRSLVHLWEGRPEQARLLYDGVGHADNPHWELLRLLLIRHLWCDTGDGRYLQLGLGAAEQLRFGAAAGRIPGMRAAASGVHALLLLLAGQVSLALEAAEESLAEVGPLALPEWPRVAVLHDLAVVYRDAASPERWQHVLDHMGDAPLGIWPERLRRLTGPRAFGALDPPSADDLVAGPTDDGGGLAAVALAVLEGRDAPTTAALRGLCDELGAHGGRWSDAAGDPVAAVGTGWRDPGDDAVAELPLPGGETLHLVGCAEARLASIDTQRLARIAAAARAVNADRRRESGLRDALEQAEAHRSAAEDAMERHRRGAGVAVVGGRFPTVAGRSRALKAALDKLGLLAGTALPVLFEGPPGTGRRHLAHAFDAHLGGQPERCPVLDVSLVPPGTMVDTLVRLEAEAAGGCYVVASAEHLTPEAASWLIARTDDAARRARPLLTLTEAEQGPLADALRRSFGAGRVRVPGLDERLEDLPRLIDAVAAAIGKRPEQIGTGARAVLARRAWPGHVAELRETLAAAAVRAGAGAVLPEHLEAVEADARETNLSQSMELGYHDAVRGFRRELLRHALRTTGGNRTRAAEILGVQRTYFMRLIRELGADDVRPGGVAT